MPTVLVVDDDPRIRESLTRALTVEGTTVVSAESAERALAMFAEAGPEVVLADVRMSGMSGIELLTLLRARAPCVDVLLMSAYEDLATVASAMREGASDFLVKPIDLHQLRRAIDRAIQDRSVRSAIASQSGNAEGASRRLVGRDPQMVSLFKLIGQVAGTRASVIIRGESGTGKELIARAIHDTSPWADQPFVAVNCTAIPATLLESELFGHVRGAFTGAVHDRRGQFAQARGGTIFLDEIGDTTRDFQSKLLRVLQEHEYQPVGADSPEQTDARVLAATHRDLENLVARGEFREDLYYRLRVIELRVPPLRSRPGDIPLLAGALVQRASHAAGRAPPILSPDALEILLGHSWPGNVRELENCLTRAVVLASGDVVRPEHLALDSTRGDATPRMVSLEEVEREHITRILQATGGNKSVAAQVLGISRPRLDRMLEKHGLAPSFGRTGRAVQE